MKGSAIPRRFASPPPCGYPLFPGSSAVNQYRTARRSTVARKTHARSTLRLGASGALRLVLVADTHSAPHPGSARHIAACEPDHILHAGDIGDLGVLEALRAIAPVTAVRGNIDAHASDLPDALTLELRDDAGPLLTLLMIHIGVYGPRLRADVARLARAEHATVVVCGHSHVPFFWRDGELVVANPGSMGPRRFHLPIVFGVMDVRRAGVTVHHVSCETGARWEP